MNLLILKKLFQSFSRQLEAEDIESIYLYGSQVDLIKDSGFIPKGKEVDLTFIKRSRLKDGEMPITTTLANNIFLSRSDIIHSYNGIWGKRKFDDNHYYFDILSEGLENLCEMTPSAKIFSIKGKILLWGKEQNIVKCGVLESDKNHLIEVMSRYVNREFCDNDSFQNRKSIFKNGLFLLSLTDESLIEEPNRDILIEKIKASPNISNVIKDILEDFVLAYKKKEHQKLSKIFNEISAAV